MKISKEELVEAIENLKHDVSLMLFALAVFEKEYLDALNIELAKPEKDVETFHKESSACKKLSDFKSEMREELLGASRLGVKNRLEMTACQRLAATLGGGLCLPKSDDYVVDSLVEIEQLLELIKSSSLVSFYVELTEEDSMASKYPGLKECYREAKMDSKLSETEKTYRKVAERYWRTLDTRNRPDVETLKRWLERHSNH